MIVSAQRTDLDKVQFIQSRMPESGLFAEKNWLISPEPFALSGEQLESLQKLGDRLHVFAQACNLLYRQSCEGKAPSWIAEWLDAGKPQELVEISRSKALKNQLPVLIRPDLILTENGWALTEIDSVPGGVGLTAWLNQVYSQLGYDPIGGEHTMVDTVQRLFSHHHCVISQEASDYRPEWEWLLGKENVYDAESYQYGDKPVYRFFENFDWESLEELRTSWSADRQITPPLKPFMEEKLWLALFWIKPLESFWIRELGRRYWTDLQKIIPYSWVVNPDPLPPYAVLPQLNVQSWNEVGQFSQKQRNLILKISGFSALAWGSRGVLLGSDVSGEVWKEAIHKAMDSFSTNPYIVQEFKKGQSFEVSYWDEPSNAFKNMKGRVRICPYYFIEENKSHLTGAMATICPLDKKLIHGMQDAIITPVCATT